MLRTPCCGREATKHPEQDKVRAPPQESRRVAIQEFSREEIMAIRRDLCGLLAGAILGAALALPAQAAPRIRMSCKGRIFAPRLRRSRESRTGAGDYGTPCPPTQSSSARSVFCPVQKSPATRQCHATPAQPYSPRAARIRRSSKKVDNLSLFSLLYQKDLM